MDSVIPCLPSPSIPLPFASPYPPYNPLYLASRLIVYSMIITPFTPAFGPYSSLSKSFLLSLSRLSIASSPHFPIMTRSTKVIIGTHTTTPSSSDHFHFQASHSLPLILTGAFSSLTSP